VEPELQGYWFGFGLGQVAVCLSVSGNLHQEGIKGGVVFWMVLEPKILSLPHRSRERAWKSASRADCEVRSDIIVFLS
jgi:hypothetical protein